MQGTKGMATGIGSLPQTDINSALDLIFKCVPQIPFWPQLPKLSAKEGMVAQFSENLPFIAANENGVFFSTLQSQDKEKALESYYEHIIANDTDYFKITKNYALGLYRFCQKLEQEGLKDVSMLKGHTTGPFTLAASINDEQGFPLLHEPIMMQALLRGLSLKAAWQINLLKKFNKEVLFFIDEPYLGCFGSAYTPMNRDEVVRGLSEFTQPLKSEGVYLAVHCCGNTDWSIFTDVPALDIISFDAFDFLDKLILYADQLKAFFGRGGVLCWGIVPTLLFTGLETSEILIRKIKEGVKAMAKKGLEEEVLYRNMLLSPACGLGTFTPEKAEKVFNLLSETSSLIRKFG